VIELKTRDGLHKCNERDFLAHMLWPCLIANTLCVTVWNTDQSG
jgi:hypothetical protein